MPIRIAILGLGAVGGHVAARLAASGNHVSAITRGPVLDALSQRPLELRTDDGQIFANIAVSDSAATLGKHDVVILTAKAHSLPSLTPMLAPLMHADTLVVFAQTAFPGGTQTACPEI